MTSHDEQRLSDALRRQADSSAPHLLSLDDVTARAGSIRRRRIAAGVVAAAAVVAVVVPTALVTTGGNNRSTPDYATQTPDATPTSIESPSETERPVTDDATPTGQLETVPIDGDLPTGAAPAIPIAVQGSVLTPDGQKIDFGDEVTYVAQVGDAYAAIVRSESGDTEFRVQSADGSSGAGAPANNDGGLAVTPDHTAVAYVGTDQRIHTWTAKDGDLVFSEKLPDIMLRGMTNTEAGTCKEPEPEGPGCTVVFSKGPGGAGYATSHGIVDDIPGFTTVNDANDGVLAGQTKSTNEGSCNEVRLGFDGKALWDTCDASPINLSPSNEYVTALPAYFESLCCSAYDVFDVAAGKKILTATVKTGAQSMSYINALGWEDETHVLATAFTADGWRVVRIGLDGKAELADTGELPKADVGEVPVRLPVGS